MGWGVIALLAVAGVLLLTNLESGYLWEDEAETALLARRTLQYGYPRAVEPGGRNAIDPGPYGYGPGESWIYAPWLPFYFLAGVFAIAGESTWVARLPFALLGWLSILLMWRLSRLLTDDRAVQRLSVALLTCSVPFLLHMRQCRYYAMTTALLLGTCCAYLALLRRPSFGRAAVLGLLLVLLFHSNFGTFVPACAAIIGHQAFSGASAARARLWITGALVAGLTVPWAFVFYRPAMIGALSFSRMADHLEYYVRVTNKHLVPIACMAVVGAAAWLARHGRVLRHDRTAQPALAWPEARTFLLIMAGAQAAFLLVPDQRHMRYLIPTLPLLVIGEAWWLTSMYGVNRRLAGALAALALFTTVLQSTHVRVPLTDLVYELTHRYTGPMDGIVSYLREHGRPGQTAKIPYDDRTLMFYTTLTVEMPVRFAQESYPDWMIIRRDWIPDGFFRSDYFRRIAAAYDRIELDAPDVLWQNREDPGSHHFRTVTGAPRVIIYRKRRS